MNLSVLLRTCNSGKELEKFRSRAAIGNEVVVVDHDSSDNTRELAREMGAKVLPYERQSFSYGAALNLGLSSCTGDWVLVASPHFEPAAADFWEQLFEELSALPPDVVACQAPIFLTPQKGMVRLGLTLIDGRDLSNLPWNFYGNTCCAYRREALDRFAFDENLSTAEDAEWCLRVVRAGFRVCVAHRIPILYRNRAPLVRYWRRGLTDGPTLAKIFGVEFRPRVQDVIAGGVREFYLLLSGRSPWWLWLRFLVKRLAELSLCFR